jgi:hypothetical protein
MARGIPVIEKALLFLSRNPEGATLRVIARNIGHSTESIASTFNTFIKYYPNLLIKNGSTFYFKGRNPEKAIQNYLDKIKEVRKTNLLGGVLAVNKDIKNWVLKIITSKAPGNKIELLFK